VVRTLCDVRHVPEVEKKLISLGTLCSNSYGYKSEGEVIDERRMLHIQSP
jgi:hypothetical protein